MTYVLDLLEGLDLTVRGGARVFEIGVRSQINGFDSKGVPSHLIKDSVDFTKRPSSDLDTRYLFGLDEEGSLGCMNPGVMPGMGF